MKFLMYFFRHKSLLSLSVALSLGCGIVFLLPEQIRGAPLMSLICTSLGVIIAVVFQSENKIIKEKIKFKTQFIKTVRRSNVERELSIVKTFHDLGVKDFEVTFEGSEKYQNLDLMKYLFGKVRDKDLIEIILTQEIMKELKDKSDDELRTLTVTQLFLLDKKKELFKSKIISVLALLIGTAGILFNITVSYYVLSIPLILLASLTALDILITHRVDKGYFGANKFEAIQLLQYIEKNKDDIGGSDSGGFSRKIFNDLKSSDLVLPANDGQEVLS